MRLFYEREESVPDEPYAAIAAAGRCKIQRERIRSVQSEMDFCEAAMEELELLPECVKQTLRETYNEILDKERKQYARCREALLELGYDDYV